MSFLCDFWCDSWPFGTVLYVPKFTSDFLYDAKKCCLLVEAPCEILLLKWSENGEVPSVKNVIFVRFLVRFLAVLLRSALLISLHISTPRRKRWACFVACAQIRRPPDQCKLAHVRVFTFPPHLFSQLHHNAMPTCSRTRPVAGGGNIHS